MSSDALRVAMYTSSLAQPGRKPGGVDILINHLANTLTTRGHEVTIWSYSPRPAGALYGHVQLAPQNTATRQLARILVAPTRLNGVSFGDAQILHLHGDDWFFIRRGLPTIRTLYGSALYEMRYATRARRMLSQAALVPLEALACLLATDAYGMIPGDGPVHRLQGYLPGGASGAVDATAERAERPTVLFVGTWKGRKRGAMLRDAVRPRRAADASRRRAVVRKRRMRGVGVRALVSDAFRRRSSSSCIGEPGSSACRADTRDSACPTSRRWRAGFRSWRRRTRGHGS